jgi:hypothetical protein
MEKVCSSYVPPIVSFTTKENQHGTTIILDKWIYFDIVGPVDLRKDINHKDVMLIACDVIEPLLDAFDDFGVKIGIEHKWPWLSKDNNNFCFVPLWFNNYDSRQMKHWLVVNWLFSNGKQMYP